MGKANLKGSDEFTFVTYEESIIILTFEKTTIIHALSGTLMLEGISFNRGGRPQCTWCSFTIMEFVGPTVTMDSEDESQHHCHMILFEWTM